MTRAIPDRWENYNPIGMKIEGTRFVAFKVPLRQHVAAKVESEKRLDDKILMERLPNLGLIIDLTYTHRYYDPTVFLKEGVQHKKLMLPGKETPPINLVKNFIEIVKNFLNSNEDNDKLIGVHCTHGINRTGYMICYYMISQMTIDPKEAVDKFAKARGYGIERINYIQDLQNLQLIEKPNWRKRKHENNQSDGNKDASNAYKGSMEQHNSFPNSRELQNWRERQENYQNNDKRDASYTRDNSNGNSSTLSPQPHISRRNRTKRRRVRYISRNNGNNDGSKTNACDSSRSRDDAYKNFTSYNKIKGFSTHQPSADQAAETSNYYSPAAERYTDNYCTMSRRPIILNLNYYNTKTEFDGQRHSNNRCPNAHEKNN